jgi:hypothetical protein
MTARIMTLDYEAALWYFDIDPKTLKMLEALPESEQENFIVEVFLNHALKTACFRMGQRDQIKNAVCKDDCYIGAREKLHTMGESLADDDIAHAEAA